MSLAHFAYIITMLLPIYIMCVCVWRDREGVQNGFRERMGRERIRDHTQVMKSTTPNGILVNHGDHGKDCLHEK